MKDDSGVKATITYPEKVKKVGLIVRKGGDSWTAKSAVQDRFIDRPDGQAGIWAAAKLSSVPHIRNAYLDSKRTVVAVLSDPLVLKGGTDGFKFSPDLKIDNVKDDRISNTGLIGYEFINTGRQVRFVLEPGRLGLSRYDEGDSTIYVSGPFNGWSNTAGDGFKPMPEWRMKWNCAARCYELTAPVGAAPGEVPAAGAEFKFTLDTGTGQEWYPAHNIAIRQGSAGGTTEVLITLAEDANVTRDYTLEHEGFRSAPILKRGVLSDQAFVYTGDDLGATYSPAATRFRLWAPTVSAAAVAIYAAPEGGRPCATAPLQADRGGTWVAEVSGDLKGRYYTYRLRTAGTQIEVMDPYAVGAGVNGTRGLIFDWKETNPPGWATTPRPAFGQGRPTDAILYEIHIRDLSTAPNSGIKHKGKFLGFTELGTTGPDGVKTGLDHLKELGVTHIHLLPCFDFSTVDEHREDQFNWGYDPQNFNLPEGSYATDPNGIARIREFKQLVQALHQNGLRVVMDVVYNHTSCGASPFEAIAPTYYYRWDVTGKLSNGSGTGNETASERPMMRKFMLDSVKLWAREYKVDGFRFDLMGLHDIETMRQIRAALDEIDPSIIIYGEPWTGGPTVLEGALRVGKGTHPDRVAVFNDNIRNAIKGNNDGAERGFATGACGQVENIKRGVAGAIHYSSWLSDFTRHPGEAINYVSSHDNLSLWDKLAKSNPDDSEEDRIKMDLLSQAIVFTSQGVPFIHGGEEMLRTKGGNHNSYNAPDSVNQMKWERKAIYPQVFRYYQGLIALRKAHPAFRLATADEVRQHLRFLDGTPANTVAFTLKAHAGGDPWQQIVVIYNPNRHDVAVSLPPGSWNVAAWGTQIGDGGSVSGVAHVPPISMLLLYQM